jgi:hypothetical protein
MDDALTRESTQAGSCPHVNRNDPRCSTRFSLGRIDQAFSVCFGVFHACPMYHRINAEYARTRSQPAPAVAITINRHVLDVPLRATGS